MRRTEHWLRWVERWLQSHGVEPGLAGIAAQLLAVVAIRAYVAAYLRSHPKIRQDMTFLVRQLAPGPTGLPLEIYVFSADQVWANYESIQADVFDHLLAVIPEFGLRVFQSPSGADVRQALSGVLSAQAPRALGAAAQSPPSLAAPRADTARERD